MMTSEDVYPVIDIQVSDFQRAYDKTKIRNISSSTRDAIVQMLNDSIKLIVCARELNQEEKEVIRKNNLAVESTKVAYDGVAVIVNKKNNLSKITVAELRELVAGAKKRWTDIKDSKLSSTIIVAIGEPNSGINEYIKSRVLNNGKYTTSLFPCSSTTEVISIVKERPNAIGFIGSAWTSKLSDEVKVLEIGDPNFKRDSLSTELEYFSPHQAHIYRNYYPLSRTIYIYSNNIGRGVGLGFAAFAAGPNGQKIIVSNGLVPATMPVRLVQLNNQ